MIQQKGAVLPISKANDFRMRLKQISVQLLIAVSDFAVVVRPSGDNDFMTRSGR
jgi:uncharacterized membrane protein